MWLGICREQMDDDGNIWQNWVYSVLLVLEAGFSGPTGCSRTAPRMVSEQSQTGSGASCGSTETQSEK